MNPSELIFAFLLVLLAGWAAVRITRAGRNRFHAESSGDQVFRCEECDYVTPMTRMWSALCARNAAHE